MWNTEFSEEQVYLIGAVSAMLVSPFVFMLYGKFSLKWFWSHKRIHSVKEHFFNAIIGLLFGVVLFYMLRKFYIFSSVIWIVGIATLLEFLALGAYFLIINRGYFEEYQSTLTSEEKVEYKGKRLTVPVLTLVVGFLLLNPLFGMAGVFFAQWVMPDVVEVLNGPKRAWYGYKVRNYYVLPYENGMKPGESYIYNQSKDTIYRVVVNYGYIGEDKYNYYTVNAKYAPHALSRLPHREIHVMDTIAPVMLASYNKKTGERYHTQRVYLTDYEHLWDFKIVNTRKFGIVRNKWVDSIKETKNRVIKEDYEKYRAYKKIDSLPYPRLRPIREKNRKSEAI